MRIRAGQHAGWEGDLNAAWSTTNIAYLWIRFAPGRTGVLVVDRANLEPTPVRESQSARRQPRPPEH